jgi:hypothetical protein
MFVEKLAVQENERKRMNQNLQSGYIDEVKYQSVMMLANYEFRLDRSTGEVKISQLLATQLSCQSYRRQTGAIGNLR